MAEFHGTKLCMPFIVQPQFQAGQLNPDLGKEALEALVRPLPDGILVAEEVAEGNSSP
jgi:hypothetical protein